MAKIEIYSWVTCPYCKRAKSLLDSKGLDYTVHNITGNEPERAKMIKRAGGASSVPQIFIDDIHYGGCDDLHALDASGELDKLING